MKFGDVVCRQHATRGHSPLLYLGPCHHSAFPSGTAALDLLNLRTANVEHEVVDAVRPCPHLLDHRVQEALGRAVQLAVEEVLEDAKARYRAALWGKP